MTRRRSLILAALLIQLASGTALGGQAPTAPDVIRWWVSSEDLRLQLAEQPALAWRVSAEARGQIIDVKPAETFQTMLGLGSSLEPSTCWNLSRMTAADRERTIDRLVNPKIGIGMNLMRICIGTPDFTGDSWYSYDDVPAGQTDQELRHFSIDKDRAYILPVLKLARAGNPELLFFASPWSPPAWMKSGGSLTGGYLLPQWYATYAEYFVKFVRAYETEGIPIHAVTVQNEPGVDRSFEKDPKWHYPSCRWTSSARSTSMMILTGSAEAGGPAQALGDSARTQNPNSAVRGVRFMTALVPSCHPSLLDRRSGSPSSTSSSLAAS